MKLSRSNKRTLPSLVITLFIVSLSVSGIACAAEVREAEVSNEIQDVLELPQNPFFYLSGDYNKRLISEEEQQDHLREFMKLYFSPWSQSGPRHGMDVHDWIFQHFGEKQGYGENLRPRSGEWLEGQKINSNFQAFRSLDRKAISVRGTDLRLLPTDRPFFYDPALPGEGFPFDHLQNSGVHGGEPLFISHLSKDGAWAWSETSYAAGWIRVEDLAFVNEEFMEKWMSLPLGVVTSDKSPLTDEEGLFRFMGTIGTILPITDRGIAKNRVLLPVRDTDGKAIVKTALLDVEHFRVHPLPFTSWNAAMVCEGLINNPYGWGGYLENRDCSSTIRDILLPFGIWMPRNSGAQAKTGLTISLEGMERSEKIRAILREATPFSTLVNKRGHVMLYIGYYHGRPVILHNTWGIGTLEEGSERRHIIGKTVLTTLEPGKELDHLHPDKGLLIDSITGITLLGGIR